MRQIILAVISLFGIFSISSSTIRQRRKEIAVRKIMGANVNKIIGMFFREYLWMAYIAAIVAFPCTYAGIIGWNNMSTTYLLAWIYSLFGWELL